MGVDISNNSGVIFTLEEMHDMFLASDEGVGFVATFNEVLEEVKQEEAETTIELKGETAEYEKKLVEYEQKKPEYDKKEAIFSEAWKKWIEAGEDQNTVDEVNKLRPETLWKPSPPHNYGTQTRESMENIAKIVKEGDTDDEASNLSLTLCKEGQWEELPLRVWSKYLDKINVDLPSFQGVEYFDQGGRYNGWDVPQEEYLYVFDVDYCYETTLSDAGKALEEVAGVFSPTEWTDYSV